MATDIQEINNTETNDSICSLCKRHTRRKPSRHHLIPQTCHSNKWFKKNFTRQQMRETIVTCSDCHRAIHQLIPSEKELGRLYNTLEKLITHPKIENFVNWVATKK